MCSIAGAQECRWPFEVPVLLELGRDSVLNKAPVFSNSRAVSLAAATSWRSFDGGTLLDRFIKASVGKAWG